MKTEYNVPLAGFTTFKIGGNADKFITAECEADILRAINDCAERNERLFTLGAGSNLLIPDEGLRGAVLYLGRGCGNVTVSGEYIYAGAGARLSKIARIAYEAGLTGLEFAAHIPGTIGGAVTMNAGAFGGDIAGVIETVRAADKGGRGVAEYNNAECGFGYRESLFSGGDKVITAVKLKLNRGDKAAIKEKTDDFLVKSLAFSAKSFM